MCRDVVSIWVRAGGWPVWRHGKERREVARMGTSRDIAQAAMSGSNLVIELPHQLGRRSQTH